MLHTLYPYKNQKKDHEKKNMPKKSSHDALPLTPSRRLNKMAAKPLTGTYIKSQVIEEYQYTSGVL